MDFLCFLAVFELMSDSLMTIYVELDQCPSHHAILLTQGRICEIFTKKFWELAILKNGHFWKTAILDFFSKKKFFFCFILMKISPNLHGRMDGLKFWCFLWFPENSLLCVKLRYTVYVIFSIIFDFSYSKITLPHSTQGDWTQIFPTIPIGLPYEDGPRTVMGVKY